MEQIRTRTAADKVRDLVDAYNGIIELTETDHSLKIVVG
jgi:hypothetical protein